MDYRALYRKWRPADFDEVCGQDKITDILKFQVAEKRIGHAYLFCGSRGTGKTSCAKILAKAVNCENPRNGNPCNQCAACRSIDAGSAVDVTEMDAASNTGVDNVRTLKEEIVFSPAELRYRVYIIDEVHMISVNAFNALLKTLEEPPAHVIFILATTELHKLPTTIVSRCQRFDFRRIDSRVITERLLHVAKEEKIDLTEDGARLIARTAQGGMRDALSLLELCAGLHRQIDEGTAIEALGIGSRQQTFDIVNAILYKDHSKLFDTVSELTKIGRDLSGFLQSLIDCYRDVMIVRSVKNPTDYLDVTDRELAALTELSSKLTMERLIAHSKLLEEALGRLQRGVADKRSTVEIALCRMCDLRLSADVESLVARVAELESKVSVLNSGQKIAFAAKSDEKAEDLQAQAVKESAVPETKEKKGSTAAVTTSSAKENDAENVYRSLSYWRDIVDALVAARPSNAGTLGGSRAYKNKKGEYRILAKTQLFAMLMKTSDLFASICAAIAEQEGKPISGNQVSIEVAGTQKEDDLIDEIVRACDETN